MSKTEKVALFVLFAILLSFGMSLNWLVQSVSEIGGERQVIITTCKEVKSIIGDINTETTEEQ